jgi:hypothetical protein
MTAADDLQRGRLEQACACGRWEAAGAYCSGCLRPMTATDWYPNGDLIRRATARQMARSEARTPLKAALDQSPAPVRHRAPRFGQNIEADARASRQAQRQRRTLAPA